MLAAWPTAPSTSRCHNAPVRHRRAAGPVPSAASAFASANRPAPQTILPVSFCFGANMSSLTSSRPQRRHAPDPTRCSPIPPAAAATPADGNARCSDPPNPASSHPGPASNPNPALDPSKSGAPHQGDPDPSKSGRQPHHLLEEAGLVLEVLPAAGAAELRAAAFLRAACFYTYPQGRSEFAERSHRLMKATAEWDSVMAKVEGRDPAFRDLDVTAFIATVETEAPERTAPKEGNDKEGIEVRRSAMLAQLRSGLDASAQLPAELGTSSGGSSSDASDPRVGSTSEDGRRTIRRPPRLVVGTLDLNVGHTLPSEELVGKKPPVDPRRRRAYLSNVCVAPSARRLGVARALLQQAEEEARKAGVEWLYVHVVADNAPAVLLYCDKMGFQAEQSESEGYARSLQRPRRLLLAKEMEPPL